MGRASILRASLLEGAPMTTGCHHLLGKDSVHVCENLERAFTSHGTVHGCISPLSPCLPSDPFVAMHPPPDRGCLGEVESFGHIPLHAIDCACGREHHLSILPLLWWWTTPFPSSVPCHLDRISWLGDLPLAGEDLAFFPGSVLVGIGASLPMARIPWSTSAWPCRKGSAPSHQRCRRRRCRVVV